MSTTSRWVTAALCTALLAAGCSSGSSKTTSTTHDHLGPAAEGVGTAGRRSRRSASPPRPSNAATRSARAACSRCRTTTSPWPTPTTPTQRRLHLAAASMPANTKGVHIDVTDQNRADGWSPGSALMVQFPGLDAAKSKLPAAHRRRRRRSTATRRSSCVDATTGERHPFWAELDANADTGQAPL